jgi:hypothetical protein
MPYRRLPNTDQARLRALQAALKMGNEIPPFKLAFSQPTMQKVRYFTPLFDGALSEQKNAFGNQVKKSKDYVSLQKKAKLYISHFIQVLNFAIMRGEIPATARKFYNISEDSKKIPMLNTEAELISYGEKIIKGESERIASRGNPMTNPTVAVVRVHFEKFMEAYRYQKTLQDITNRSLSKINEMRKEADEIILNVWNEVEDSFSELNETEKRTNCEKYGLVYVFRSHEKERMKQQQEERQPVEEVVNTPELPVSETTPAEYIEEGNYDFESRLSLL